MLRYKIYEFPDFLYLRWLEKTLDIFFSLIQMDWLNKCEFIVEILVKHFEKENFQNF